MDERVDEKILSYINAAEKLEKQKDICNGKIKIIDRYYEFKETEFFDEKLKMYIPESFQDMPLEARRFKYPSESRPEIIKCNEDGSIAITLNVIDSPLNEDYVEKIRDLMKLMNQRLNPANLYFDEGILEVDEKNIGFYDFKSSALDDYLYNLIFLLEFQEKTLMGTFSCSYGIYKEWKGVAMEMIKTIRVHKEEEKKIEKITAKIR